MSKSFAEMLAVGGKSNSLGLASEVVQCVLKDKSRLPELYNCLFEEDAWLRMRAIDALEKICRVHPQWLLPFTDRIIDDLSDSTQPSIQWHLAQIYAQVDLTPTQKRRVIKWLKSLLSTVEVDWIAAANSMETLMQFTKRKEFPCSEMTGLLKIQTGHKSKSVVKKANKLLTEIRAT